MLSLSITENGDNEILLNLCRREREREKTQMGFDQK